MPRALFSLLLLACGTAPPIAPCPTSAASAGVVSSRAEGTRPVDEAAEEALVTAQGGACDLRAIPESMRLELDADASFRLTREVAGWLSGERGMGFNQRSGVLFAKSEDDLGAEPPYPTHTRAQGVHACGVQAGWLVSSSRAAMRAHADEDAGPVRCQGNVCCYAARGEFDSAGGVVFSEAEGGRFRIRAVYQVADNGTLVGEFISQQYSVVNRHLDRLSGRSCPAEPQL